MDGVDGVWGRTSSGPVTPKGHEVGVAVSVVVVVFTPIHTLRTAPNT